MKYYLQRQKLFLSEIKYSMWKKIFFVMFLYGFGSLCYLRDQECLFTFSIQWHACHEVACINRGFRISWKQMTLGSYDGHMNATSIMLTSISKLTHWSLHIINLTRGSPVMPYGSKTWSILVQVFSKTALNKGKTVITIFHMEDNGESIERNSNWV